MDTNAKIFISKGYGATPVNCELKLGKVYTLYIVDDGFNPDAPVAVVHTLPQFEKVCKALLAAGHTLRHECHTRIVGVK